jgi:hypothetical protein
LLPLLRSHKYCSLAQYTQLGLHLTDLHPYTSSVSISGPVLEQTERILCHWTWSSFDCSIWWQHLSQDQSNLDIAIFLLVWKEHLMRTRTPHIVSIASAN